MKKFIFLTNIPTPYRTSFWDDLFKEGLNFKVYYMRHTEADRNWEFVKSNIHHPFYIDSGFYKMIGRYHLHINPQLIFNIIKVKDADIIIGGSWNDINVLVLVLLKRIGLIKGQFIFWSEANYLTIGAINDNLLKRFLRKYVYHSSTGGQIRSGKMAELTFNKWGIKVQKYIDLPNTIQEDKFKISDEEVADRYTNNPPIFLMPVRLNEAIKGVMNFFTAIGDENIRKGQFLIAGDGPDKDKISQFIISHEIDSHVQLLGHIDTENMVLLYKKANVFVLPSFSDPSPLTLIEALAMKLPLLVSDRCGNHFEALENQENGYLFSPSDHHSIKQAFESLMLRFNDWGVMGEKSGIKYKKIFSKQLVIKNFMLQLTDFCT